MKDAAPLVLSQGAVREGAQAIDNLLHLLGSRRVGPKAIASALVDVRDGCKALVSAIDVLERELLDLLCADEEARDLSRSLLRRAAACVERLESELFTVRKAEVDARARLSVEAATRRASDELGGLLFLVDLLACAATPRLTLLDARDVLEGQAITPASRAGPAMRAAAAALEPITFLGDARLVGGLLLLAFSVVEKASGRAPLVNAKAMSGERLEVRITSAPAPAGQAGMSEAGRPPTSSAALAGGAMARAALGVVARLARIGLAAPGLGQEVALVFGKASQGA